MRILFVNHCHPDMPHVCAQRAARFAEACAEAGHQVVLLTETLDKSQVAVLPRQLHQELEAHVIKGAKTPYHIACPPVHSDALEGLRAGTLHKYARAALIASQYTLKGSLFTDWRRGALPALPVIAGTFKPDVTWGTFGNTEAWHLARQVAKMSHCPWVMDIKDPWESFIPAKLQKNLARRFNDCAAITTISQAHAERAEVFWTQEKTVVYSGIPESFLEAPEGQTDTESFNITLMGGVYEKTNIQVFGAALGAWLRALPPAVGERIRFSYVGSDHELVRKTLQNLMGRCQIDIRGYVPLDEMRTLIESSHINAYLRSATGPFHHKIFELLSAARPVLVFPEETVETKAIAEKVEGKLYSCENPEAILQALQEAIENRGNLATPPNKARMSEYTWKAQAAKLVEVFERVTKK